MKINNWLSNIQDWLLPRLCPGCGQTCKDPGQHLCPGCRDSLPVIEHCCPRCAIPYMQAPIQGTCGTCQQNPPAFASALALYRYAPPVDHFIRSLKFHHDLAMAALLGQSLAAAVSNLPVLPDVILPVPLHPARLRHRGFNQAVEIARPVARALGMAVDLNGVVRTRDTASQIGLTKPERRRNLRRAFEARRDYGGLSVALIDDVMTTGETAHHLARTLLKAGAREVTAWVIARTSSGR
jgi:ComF family protein